MNSSQSIAKAHLAAFAVAIALLGCSAKKPEDHVQAAKAALEKKDPKAATIEAKNALQLDPDRGEARFILGKALLMDRNPAAAEIELRKSITSGYSASKAAPDLATALFQLGQFKKVTDEFGASAPEEPLDRARLQTVVAESYRAMGNQEKSRESLQLALTAMPNLLPARLESARQKAAAQDIDGALSAVDEALKQHSNSGEAWKLKGDIETMRGSEPEALAAYQKAIAADPKLASARLAMAALLFRQNKLDEANAELSKLKEASGESLQGKFLEARIALSKREPKRAQELTANLLRSLSKNPLVLQLAGEVELSLNSFAQAEIYLTRALQAAPDSHSARRLLVATNLRAGNVSKAIEVLEAGLQKGKLDPSLYSIAGQAYLQAGDSPKAQDYFSQALALDPKDLRRRTALAVARLSSNQSDLGIQELQDLAVADKGTTAELALVSAYLYRKDFAKALRVIDGLEAKTPDSAMAPNLRGRTHLMMKDVEAAKKSFEKALALDPLNFLAAANLASIALSQGQAVDARKQFERILQKDPKHTQALLALAKLASDTGSPPADVATLLTKAVDAHPTDAAARVLLVDNWLRAGDPKRALEAAQAAATALPTNVDALDALGRAQLLSGNVSQAISTFGKLTSAEPLVPRHHLRMANAQLLAKDPRSAEQSLRKALEIKPDLLDAHRGLIQLALAEKRTGDASKLASALVSQYPNSALSHVILGDVHAASGKMKEAAVSYQTALQSRPGTEIAMKLHWAKSGAGDLAGAGKFADAWAKDHPADLTFKLHLGDSALTKGDYTGAEKHYQAALAVEPNNPVALNNVAWVLMKQGKPTSVALAERANTLKPNYPPFIDTLAQALAISGQSTQAVQLLSKAVSLHPKDQNLQLSLAQLHAQSGDKGQALPLLQKLAESDKATPAQTKARELLKSMQ